MALLVSQPGGIMRSSYQVFSGENLNCRVEEDYTEMSHKKNPIY